METKVAPIINKYWVEDAFPFELLPAIKELNLGGLGMQGYGCRGGSALLVRPGRDGDVAGRLVDRDLLRRPQRPGHGLDLRRGIGGAEAEVAAADGSLREDRLFRPDRAAGGLRSVRRPDDDGETRGRHLGLERPEEVDRQFALVRRLDHLGARRRRQSGQGLHRREQDHARLQRREDPEQDRAQGGPERLDHAEGRPGARGEPPSGRQVVPRHRAGAAHDAVSRRVGGDGLPDGSLRARPSSTPRSVCNSAGRSARSSLSRTCSPG